MRSGKERLEEKQKKQEWQADEEKRREEKPEDRREVRRKGESDGEIIVDKFFGRRDGMRLEMLQPGT